MLNRENQETRKTTVKDNKNYKNKIDIVYMYQVIQKKSDVVQLLVRNTNALFLFPRFGSSITIN